ncbi:VWFA and cache domain-containing protein CG16868-like isoform X2 [Mercenaria mercenaria]|uniref:VWFA and cache domain-containing protein CG16868-like isoform X2 n=1 Tax=Mercenaria mercenaria TaxID=6596 RepID=UPI00234E755D|nr:VWFA and cache domain-containing protein CG16868-like isoform X2 [Mercenaria mercenaria]
MGNNSIKNFLFMKCLGILVLLLNVCSVSLEKFDESQMKQIAATFKQELDSHIDKVLAYGQIEQKLQEFETHLVHGPINGEDIFNEIFQNVSLRYNDVVLAANRLKQVLEKDVGLLDNVDSTGAPPPGGGPPPVPLTKCCCESSPGVFDARLHDRVQAKECYGSQDALLESLGKTGFVDKLKENYKGLRGVTWQYFADSAGHYVQYPTSNRACDRSAPPLLGSCSKLDSPLTKEWFVEKLRMEHKNLVILMDNSMKRDPSVPPVAESVIVEAVVKILDTLTPSDKVNVVAFPSSTSETVEVPTRCSRALFVASQANLNNLKVYTKQLTPGTGEPNLMGGLKKVYSLLEAEKNENPDNFKTRTNLVLILLHGQSKPFPQEETPVLEMIAQHQLKQDNRAQHFIYTLGKPADSETLDRLAQVADQNNLKLEKSSGVKVQAWPQIPGLVTNQSVGPEGVLVSVDNGADFVSAVGEYFQRLPSQVDKELTTLVPILDDKYGLGLTVAVPVYNGTQPIGVVAADGSLATIFSEIVNFKTGINSYMYMVDSTHGHVLLHPKLRDPAETRYKDTIFPRLDLLEPDLSVEQRNKILTASTSNVVSFSVQVTDIQPEIDGELVPNRLSSLSQATVYCQQISGTRLVIALVHYESDDEEPKFHKLNQLSLHGIYHRLDKLFGAPDFPGKDSICHLHNGHFLSFKQSVIKFAPSLFSEPELYKYSDETLNAVVKLNRFLTDGNYTDILNPGLTAIVLHTLAATDKLDSLWTGSANQVIERFYGSTDGVFRMYPGSPLVNTFDHRETDWYKRSVAFPKTTMYHYGKLSIRNTNNVIIISRAIGMKRLQGVVGMTVTPRFLLSQLLNTVKDCSGNDLKCHVVDSTGRIFDALNPGSEGQLTKMYPWLTAELVTRRKIKQEWCTGFSDGFHKMILTLTEDVTSNATDRCLQFSLHKVKDTNLFVLVLGSREKLKCVESNYKICSSCQTSNFNPVYQLSIPKCRYCHVNETMTRCQCQCYCDTDLNTCHGQFNIHLHNFPTRSCFYTPTYKTEFIPDAPGPGSNLDRCPIPCVAII